MLKTMLAITRFADNGQADPRRLAALSKQVADLSVEAVYQRVAGSVGSMTLCETRGYIRARAAAEIRKQTRLAAQGEPNDAQPAIARLAVERLVPQVLRQLAAAPVAASATLQRAA